MKKKFILTIIVIVILSIFGSIFVGYSENKFVNTIKFFVPKSVKNFVKENIFFVSNLKSQIYILNNVVKGQNVQINYLKDQIKIQKKNINYLLTKLNKEDEEVTSTLIEDIKIIKSEKQNIYQLKKFYYPAIPWQFNESKPSGYLYQYNDFIFIASGDGTLTYFKIDEIDNKEIKLNIIKTNLQKFLNDKNIINKGKTSIRGIYIKKDKIFLSYNKKIKEGCYNTSIMISNLDFKKLNFEDFFTYEECSNNISNHTGGRIIDFNENSFLFTIGDGQKYVEAQNDNSMWGKLLQINFNGNLEKIIAKGLRNTQGGSYYKKGKVLILSDHGPSGGDEINLLKIEDFKKKVNFGWPTSTYGKIKYIEIPENKFTIDDKLNHSKNGFKEPVKFYNPSIAPSHIINVDNFRNEFKNDFFMSTMGNFPGVGRRSLHHIKFDDEFKSVIYNDIIPIGERIRDMIFLEKQRKIILLLELSPSISVIEPL